MSEARDQASAFRRFDEPVVMERSTIDGVAKTLDNAAAIIEQNHAVLERLIAKIDEWDDDPDVADSGEAVFVRRQTAAMTAAMSGLATSLRAAGRRGHEE